MHDQRLAPQRCGADDGAMGKMAQRIRLAADEHVARVLARQHRGDREPGRQHGRHVLGRMHRQLDRAGNERLLDLLGEQALAARLVQRSIANDVAGGADDFELDALGVEAMGGGEMLADEARLRERERAAARSDAQDVRLHAVTSQSRAGLTQLPTVSQTMAVVPAQAGTQ